MEYTSFGLELKAIRKEHNQTLGDMADILGVSPSMLSAVETGKKKAPSSWFGIIRDHYHLSSDQIKDLEDKANEFKRSARFSMVGQPEYRRNLVFSLYRSFDDIDEKTAKSIIKILEKKHG